jgi:ABC-type phosphate transport system permease subunit
MIIAINGVYICICIGLALYQAFRFDVQQKRISHTMWAIWYGIGSLLLLLITFKISWYYISCFILSLLYRVVVFNPALNLNRKPKRSFFYTNPSDPKGSVIDKLIGKHYKLFYWACVVLAIAANIAIYCLSYERRF